MDRGTFSHMETLILYVFMNYRYNLMHLSGLNDQQRDAVLSRSRIVYVTAGPGTGKTHMLTSKLIDYIVSSH